MSLFHPLSMKNNEFYYRASRISESHWLLGVPVVFTPALSYKNNVQGDPTTVEYGSPENINLSVIELPKVTLERRGWITETGEPLVVVISSVVFPRYVEWRNDEDDPSNMDKVEDFLIPVRRYSLVEIPYMLEQVGTKVFKIMDIYGSTLRPLTWECRLAPVRDITDVDPSREGVQESILDPSQDPNDPDSKPSPFRPSVTYGGAHNDTYGGTNKSNRKTDDKTFRLQ